MSHMVLSIAKIRILGLSLLITKDDHRVSLIGDTILFFMAVWLKPLHPACALIQKF